MSKFPVKRNNPKNRRNKFVLEFDEKKREEYLTGFHKRKNERRKKAKEDEIKMLKEKKKQVKEKKKAEYEEHLKALKLASSSDVMYCGQSSQKVSKETVHTMPSHTITVTELDFNPSLLQVENKEEGDNHNSSIESDEDNPEAETVSMKGKKRKNELRDKKKYKKKHHVSYTHAHHQRKKVTSAPSRLRQKKELAKKAKRRR